MSFVPNSAQQISLFDKLAFLSKRNDYSGRSAHALKRVQRMEIAA